MNALPRCPKCNSEYTYKDGMLFVCPECANEWTNDVDEKIGDNALTIKDAYGNTLQDGDAVTVLHVISAWRFDSVRDWLGHD